MASELTPIGRLLHGQHRSDPISLPISREQYDDPTFIPRLSFAAVPRRPTDLKRMTEMLPLHRGYAFFIDTNLLNLPHDWWDALLEEPGRVYLTGRVLRELVPVGERMGEHPLKRALRDQNPAIVMQADPADEAANRVFRYYIYLLGARRLHLQGTIRRFREQHGRDPEKDELTAMKMRFQRWAGERALRINTKPVSDMRTDEALIVLAVTHAIRTGQPTKIVSADLDVEEQFYLMVRLLTMHYYEMLLSSEYANDFVSFRPRPIPPEQMRPYSRLFDEMSATAIDLGGRGIHDFLSSKFTFVPIGCWTLGNDYASELVYGAETEMAKVLDIKAATNGRPTDRLGGRCAHPWMLPEELSELGSGRALIARDITAFEVPDGLRVSQLDLMSTYWPGDPHATVARPADSSLVLPFRKARQAETER